MPIVFGQPGPMDAGASAAGGRAQVMTQDNQTLAGLMKAVAEAYQQKRQLAVESSIADQKSRQSGAETAYTQMARNQNQANQLAQQDNEAQIKADASVQQDKIKASAELEMQNRKFTQADRIKIEKFQNGYAQVDAMDASPEEKADLKLGISSGLSLYQAREQRSKDQQRKQQTELMAVQAQALGNAVKVQNATTMQGLDSVSVPEYDRTMYAQVSKELSQKVGFTGLPPQVQDAEIRKRLDEMDGAYQGRYLPKAGGGFEWFPAPKKEKTDKPYGVMTESQFEDKLGREYNAQQKDQEFLNEDQKAWWNDQGGIRLQQDLQNRMKSKYGLPSSYNDYLQMRSAKPGQPAPQGQQGQPAPQPDQQQAGQPPRPKPFDLGKPSTEWEQQVVSQRDSDIERIASNSGLPEGMRIAGQNAVRDFASLTAKYGGPPPATAPVQDRQKFGTLAQFLKPILQGKQGQPAPQGQQPQQGQPGQPQQPGQQPAANDPTAMAQRLLDANVTWYEAKKTLTAQGVDPAPFEQAYMQAMQDKAKLAKQQGAPDPFNPR